MAYKRFLKRCISGVLYHYRPALFFDGYAACFWSPTAFIRYLLCYRKIYRAIFIWICVGSDFVARAAMLEKEISGIMESYCPCSDHGVYPMLGIIYHQKRVVAQISSLTQNNSLFYLLITSRLRPKEHL